MGKKTITRNRLVRHLDEYLNVGTIIDDSLNGLQVEGAARVARIALAVDACQQTITAAVRARAEILIVHHGLFWGRRERITGVMQARIKRLLTHNISLYAAHLPLDCHREIGNNAELARLLGFDVTAPFAKYKGIDIGILAGTPRPVSRTGVVKRIERELDTTATVLPFGPTAVKRIGIVSGGGDFAVGEALQHGCDTFITGETSHVAFHFAKEGKMNIIYAGHYASETVGLKALGRHLGDRYGVACTFLSAPTGF